MYKASTWWQICGPWCPPDVWAVGVLVNMWNQLVEMSHRGPSALSAQTAETWLSDIQEKWACIWFDSIWSPSIPFPTCTYTFISDIRPQEGRKSALDHCKCRCTSSHLKQHSEDFFKSSNDYVLYDLPLDLNVNNSDHFMKAKLSLASAAASGYWGLQRLAYSKQQRALFCRQLCAEVLVDPLWQVGPSYNFKFTIHGDATKQAWPLWLLMHNTCTTDFVFVLSHRPVLSRRGSSGDSDNHIVGRPLGRKDLITLQNVYRSLKGHRKRRGSAITLAVNRLLVALNSRRV